MRRPLLMVLVMGLGGLLFAQWRIAPVAPPTLSVRPAALGVSAAADARSLGTFTMPLEQEATYEVIDQRPVFVQDRKPLEPAATAGAAPEGPTGTDTLDYNAVLITPKGRLALVLDTQSKKLSRLTLGERINGWTVGEITEQSLRLTNGGGKVVDIPLRVFQPVLPGPPPPPTQASAGQTPDQAPPGQQKGRLPRPLPRAQRAPVPPQPEGEGDQPTPPIPEADQPNE